MTTTKIEEGAPCSVAESSATGEERSEKNAPTSQHKMPPPPASAFSPSLAGGASSSFNATDYASSSAAVVFPCIEQPTRVALHCNGYYLWGLKNGKIIARKRRSEKDEFRIDAYPNDSNGNASGMVKITSHKFGGALSVVDDSFANDGKTKTVMCVVNNKKETPKKQ